MNDIDTTLDQATPRTPTQQDIPEAVASVTYSIVSSSGFPALFTVRATSGEILLAKMQSVEKKLIELNYKPQEKGYKPFKKDVIYVEGQTCPKCNARLIEASIKDGRKMWKCENQKYDFQTKSVTGCTYTVWL